MASTIIIIALVAFSLVALAADGSCAKANRGLFKHESPGFRYDCSGKEDGNYPHPTNCTHYVACVARKHAYEMICALNNDGNPLHYVAWSGPNPATSRCDYPEVAGCQGAPRR